MAKRERHVRGERLSWQSTIDWVRASCEAERWRLAMLVSLPHWQEFIVAWSSAAAQLKRVGVDSLCPRDYGDFDSRLAWTWDIVDEAIDAVLLVLDERSVLCNHEIVAHFQALRGASLIFADGTVHKHVQERIDRAQIRYDASESAEMFLENLRVEHRQRLLNKRLAGETSTTKTKRGAKR